MASDQTSPVGALRAARNLGSWAGVPMHCFHFNLGDDSPYEPPIALRAAIAAIANAGSGAPAFAFLAPGQAWTSSGRT